MNCLVVVGLQSNYELDFSLFKGWNIFCFSHLMLNNKFCDTLQIKKNYKWGSLLQTTRTVDMSKCSHIALALDDVKLNFDPNSFLNAMIQSPYDVASPLVYNASHSIMFGKTPQIPLFIEYYFTVFTSNAWKCLLDLTTLAKHDNNYYGWGLDVCYKSFCPSFNLGLLNKFVSVHTPRRIHKNGKMDLVDAETQMMQLVDLFSKTRPCVQRPMSLCKELLKTSSDYGFIEKYVDDTTCRHVDYNYANELHKNSKIYNASCKEHTPYLTNICAGKPVRLNSARHPTLSTNVLISYAYYSPRNSNNPKHVQCMKNAQFFIKHGIETHEDKKFKNIFVQTIFNVIGDSDISFLDAKRYKNFRVNFQKNYGVDVFSHYNAVQNIKQYYDYYVFLNCGALGPFQTSHLKSDWIATFLERFNYPNVGLVGPSISSQIKPHVQSHFVVVPRRTLKHIMTKWTYGRRMVELDVVVNVEVDLSYNLIKEGYNIRTLYSTVNKNTKFKCFKNPEKEEVRDPFSLRFIKYSQPSDTCRSELIEMALNYVNGKTSTSECCKHLLVPQQQVLHCNMDNIDEYAQIVSTYSHGVMQDANCNSNANHIGFRTIGFGGLVNQLRLLTSAIGIACKSGNNLILDVWTTDTLQAKTNTVMGQKYSWLPTFKTDLHGKGSFKSWGDIIDIKKLNTLLKNMCTSTQIVPQKCIHYSPKLCPVNPDMFNDTFSEALLPKLPFLQHSRSASIRLPKIPLFRVMKNFSRNSLYNSIHFNMDVDWIIFTLDRNLYFKWLSMNDAGRNKLEIEHFKDMNSKFGKFALHIADMLVEKTSKLNKNPIYIATSIGNPGYKRLVWLLNYFKQQLVRRGIRIMKRYVMHDSDREVQAVRDLTIIGKSYSFLMHMNSTFSILACQIVQQNHGTCYKGFGDAPPNLNVLKNVVNI
jgi:hypothetical protein